MKLKKLKKKRERDKSTIKIFLETSTFSSISKNVVLCKTCKVMSFYVIFNFSLGVLAHISVIMIILLNLQYHTAKTGITGIS